MNEDFIFDYAPFTAAGDGDDGLDFDATVDLGLLVRVTATPVKKAKQTVTTPQLISIFFTPEKFKNIFTT